MEILINICFCMSYLGFRCMLAPVVKKRTPRDIYFFQKLWFKLYTWNEPLHSQKMPIYFPSGKYKLSIHSFLEYCYIIVFVHNILCIPGCLVHEKHAQTFFSLKWTIICIKSFTFNNMTFSISVSFLNEILFLH